jgi:hypothetical protein
MNKLPRCGTAFRLLSTLPLIAALPVLIAADTPTGGAPGVRSFVLTNIFFSGPKEAGTCTQLADGGVESFYNSLPPAERAAFADPAKRRDLERLMIKRLGFKATKMPPGAENDTDAIKRAASAAGFPAGKGRAAFANKRISYDSCTDPLDFMQLAEGYRLYDGKIAEGANLDGKQKKGDFHSASGQPGIDNQVWKALGCTKAFRDVGERENAREVLMSAAAPTLIEVRGIDDPRNDPDVTVNVMAASDALARDGRGGPLQWSSFATDPDPALRTTTKGRIVDGVLTTDPVDMRLNYKEQIIDAPRDLRSARIRLTFNSDGSVDGRIDGYYTLASLYDSIEQMSQAGASASGISCPGVYKAIHALADGYPDRKTGRKTAISSALGFVGVPAFAVPPERIAAAGKGAGL